MNYYLVKGTVYKSTYIDRRVYFEDMRLVRAEDVLEARTKYENYWHSQSSEYDCAYLVSDMEVLETIL